MENETGKRNAKARHVPVALGLAGGTGIGVFVGRAMSGPGSAAVLKLAETLAMNVTLQTAGPIIGAAIAGSSSILAAIAVPVVVMWALKKEEEDK